MCVDRPICNGPHPEDVVVVRVSSRIDVLQQFDFIERLVEEILVILDHLTGRERTKTDGQQHVAEVKNEGNAWIRIRCDGLLLARGQSIGYLEADPLRTVLLCTEVLALQRSREGGLCTDPTVIRINVSWYGCECRVGKCRLISMATVHRYECSIHQRNNEVAPVRGSRPHDISPPRSSRALASSAWSLRTLSGRAQRSPVDGIHRRTKVSQRSTTLFLFHIEGHRTDLQVEVGMDAINSVKHALSRYLQTAIGRLQ